uniref:RING-type E3 ubiquitin transferase n=1 Tax=Compsopogon caeruleus TaxID=31354 RepID=A0A6T6C4K2_9RHOD|mmetsp:Transcript_314/g.538  ORF Transcript_314/g.538 Transcript_314/m.538 type:complete len:243 (+) Transcript_314:37-765(+)
MEVSEVSSSGSREQGTRRRGGEYGGWSLNVGSSSMMAALLMGMAGPGWRGRGESTTFDESYVRLVHGRGGEGDNRVASSRRTDEDSRGISREGDTRGGTDEVHNSSCRLAQEVVELRSAKFQFGWVCSSVAELGCPICMESYVASEELRLLPCLHGFHVNCVDSWLRLKGTCPVCRWKIQDTAFEEDSHCTLRQILEDSPPYLPPRTSQVSLIDESVQVSWADWIRDTMESISRMRRNVVRQ